jgi:hypothetical protein
LSDAAGRYQIMAAVPGKIKTDTWDWASRANARADLAEQRADTAYKERNELLREIGDLERTIAELTAEVRFLKERLDGKAT